MHHEPVPQPNGNPANLRGFSSESVGGAHYLFANPHMQFLSENIAFDTTGQNQTPPPNTLGIYQRLGRHNDGLTVSEYPEGTGLA